MYFTEESEILIRFLGFRDELFMTLRFSARSDFIIHLHEQKVPDNSEVHRSLQECGSSVGNLLGLTVLA